ncbi:MAG TPA: PEP-CTERM-box response regulator transcription factor [Rhizomicrobium sp.]|jgi:two-component system NtrC family response regulator|nr:PEP-CTERM-box response regulator transcription factor [Rhizomicrobium sp.]
MNVMDVKTDQSPDALLEQILLVEDDIGLQRQMSWALTPFEVTAASSREEAVSLFQDHGGFRIVVLDLGLPPDPDGAAEGLGALGDILSLDPRAKVIVASGNSDRANAVAAVGKGAFDFIGKPVDIDVLKIVIERARRMCDLEEENRELRKSVGRSSGGLVYASPQMAAVQRIIERAGPSDLSILIVGETGTGKELAAKAIHEVSSRKSQKFAAINCASIPENLLESELFGHEKGAFTGAVKQTPGKVEIADKGTLFLDEIGDMPLALQAKMLRFLQDQKFERVGGRSPISVNVRVLAATNKPLEKMIEDGTFREDLYYRLNGIKILLPPLRDRDGDPLMLAHHFIHQFSRANYRSFRGLSEDAVRAIGGYSWPGNVRELENRMKRAVVMAEGQLIIAADLDLAAPETETLDLDLRAQTQRLERRLVQEAMALAQGNVSKAAKLLGVSRPHLYSITKFHQS